MRRWIVSSIGLLTVVACLLGARVTGLIGGPLAGAASAAAPVPDRLVVHEWGTFTTFSGSDGVRLDFRPFVENELPEFVFDRVLQAGAQSPFAKGRTRASVRMETPVIYFYTDRERDVNVRVGFRNGLLTEFYPPVARMEPPFTWDKASQGEKIQDSLLDWGTVHLLPRSSLKTSIANPQVAAAVDERLPDSLLPTALGNHYAHARATDSALVHVNLQNAAGPRLWGGTYFEKFLFYRGVGKFELPVKLESAGNGSFVISNSDSSPIRSLFLVTVHDDEICYRPWGELAAGARLTLLQSESRGTLEALSSDVEQALVDAGLYEKEARAMVKTWSDSWFREQGTRLFYLVPRPLTDAVLPLTIEPAPDELLRVLVGRLEIMPKEEEAEMLELVLESAKLRAQRAAEDAHPIPEKLLKLGRLAEPALVRIKYIAREASVRTEATTLLQELPQAIQ